MKNNIFISFFFSIAILFSGLTSFNSYAETSVEAEQIKEFISRPIQIDPSKDDFDYAHKWFSEIFGDFIFAPWEGDNKKSVTLISRAIGFTNILALILGVVIVYYVFIGGSINAAGKGEAMGQNWSGTWMPIRTMIGFGLIMPVSKLGGGAISLSQVFIIWLIMLGSNAASSLWSNIGQEITQNGVTVTAPVITLNRNQVREIAKMMHCAHTLTNYSGGKDEFLSFNYGPNKEKMFGSYKDEDKAIYSVFTKVKDQVSFTLLVDELEDVKKTYNYRLSSVEFGESGQCGIFSFSDIVDGEGFGDNRVKAIGYKAQAINTGYNAARKEMLSIMERLHPIVIQILNDFPNLKILETAIQKYNTNNQKELTKSEKEFYNSKYLKYSKLYSKIAEDYAENFVGIVHKKISSNEDMINKFKNEMTHGGWGGAGMWFHEIGVLSSLSYKAVHGFISDTDAPDTEVCTDYSYLSWFTSSTVTCKKAKEDYDSGMYIIDDLFRISVKDAKQATESDKLNMNCLSGTCSVTSTGSDRYSVQLGQTILDIFAESESGMGDKADSNSFISGTGSDTSVNPAIMSPFQAVTTIGNNMNMTAAGLYVFGSAMTLGMESAKESFIGKSIDVVTGFSTGANAVFKTWVLPLIMGTIMALIGMGYTLAYVLPFLPIITWTLMVIGYLVTVIEALIAAPLAVILMVTPEGEGISGTRLERAMQLIATAILKPSLMVIGLLASVTVGYVAFQIWNEFFFKTAEHVLTGSAFDFIAVLSIYTMTCFSICKQIIGIMHRLPNQILEWFSSGVGRSFGEDSAERAVESATGELRTLASGVGKGIADSVKSTEDRKKAVISGKA